MADIRPRSIPAAFFDSAQHHAHLAALRFKSEGSWRTWTYQDLANRVKSVASGILAQGIEPGDRIAIFAANGPGWYVVDLASMTAGAISVPIYSTSSAGSVGTILEHSGAKWVFVSEGSCAETLRKINVKGLNIVSMERLNELAARGAGSGGDVLEARLKSIREEDLATIIYTSGTTGEAKGVMLTHKNILSNCEATRPCFTVYPGDRTLSFLPLSHAVERVAGMFLMLFRGVTISVAEDLNSIASNLLEVHPTVLICVPRILEKFHARIYEAVTEKPEFLRRLFERAVSPGRKSILKRVLFNLVFFRKIRSRLGGSLRVLVSGGAALSPEIGRFFGTIGIPVLEGYGLTETSPVISVNRVERNKLGTVGLPLPGVDVKIASDGEILTRGENLMKGYFKNPEATAEAIDPEGWFHTGDIGEIDSEGFLKITDRKKDLIVTSGGKKVAPQPIENELKLNPLISHVALVGDGRKYIVALIVPEMETVKKKLITPPDVRTRIQEAVDAVNAKRASFEQIKRFELIHDNWSIESGELTPTMKLKRKVVSQNYAALIDRMYTEGGS